MPERVSHRRLAATLAVMLAIAVGHLQSEPAAAATRYTYVFPVVGRVSYAYTHSKYPASDIMAKCGRKVVSAVDGVVLEVNRVDTWTREENDGATRGGLFVSILGEDGVRYYGSHLSVVTRGIKAGVRVRAGQQIGNVGRTGRSGACHLHFGISPPCAGTGDWWIRRGTVWPGRFLDSWRKLAVRKHRSPAVAVAAWHDANGCPPEPGR